MNQQEKTQVLHQLMALLQDNHGNRITPVLATGLCSQLDALLPVDPPPAATPATTTTLQP